jgi:hypothetical protein
MVAPFYHQDQRSARRDAALRDQAAARQAEAARRQKEYFELLATRHVKRFEDCWHLRPTLAAARRFVKAVSCVRHPVRREGDGANKAIGQFMGASWHRYG